MLPRGLRYPTQFVPAQFFCILWRYKRIFILKSLNISLEEEMEQMIAKIIFSTDYQIHTHSFLIWQDMPYEKLKINSVGW